MILKMSKLQPKIKRNSLSQNTETELRRMYGFPFTKVLQNLLISICSEQVTAISLPVLGSKMNPAVLIK